MSSPCATAGSCEPLIRSIRLLNLRRLVRQPLRAVLATVAVAAGVSLAVAVLVVRDSVRISFAHVGSGLAGPAPLRVVGPMNRGGLPASVVDKVAAVDGVAAAVPVVQGVTVVERANGTRVLVLFVGADCRLESLLGNVGCSPDAVAHAADTAAPITSHALVQSAGNGAFVRGDGARVPLNPALATDRLDALDNGRVVVFPLPQAQHIFDRVGRYDVIYVQPRPGVDVGTLRHRLTATLDPWDGVLAATDPPPGANFALQSFLPLFGLLSFFTLAIGVILIGNIVTLGLEERRRDLAITQAVGGSARLLTVAAMAEMGVVGLVGGLLGAGGAVLIARPITASLTANAQRIAGVHLGVHVAAGLVALAALIGVVAALLAAWLPARRAMRADVAAELSSRGMRTDAAPVVSVRRTLTYTAIGGGGIGLTFAATSGGGLAPWQPLAAVGGVLVSSVALLLAVGSGASLLVRALARATRRSSAVVRLALANLQRVPRRTSVMAIAVGAAVGTAFLIASSITSIHDSVRNGFARGRGVWVSTLAMDNTFNIDARISPAVLDELARVPGVARVERQVFVQSGHRDGRQIGVFAADDQSFPFHRVLGPPGRVVVRQGRVLVGTTLARARHLRVGSALRLETRTGYRSVTVGAVWESPDDNGNSVTMSMALFDSVFGHEAVPGALFVPARGISDAQLAARLAPVSRRLDTGIRVETWQRVGEEVAHDIAGFVAPFWALQRGMLVVAFVAVLSTLLLVGVQRRRELGLLAAVGTSPPELAGMALAEAGTIGVIGSVLGTAAGGGMLVAFYNLAPIAFGVRSPTRIDVAAPAVWGVVALATVLAGAALPALRAVRLPVVEALQYE